MTRLKGLNWKEVEGVLKKCGFQYAPKRGKGSHLAYVRKDESNQILLVIVPRKKDIPINTVLSIIKQAGLTVNDFIENLKK